MKNRLPLVICSLVFLGLLFGGIYLLSRYGENSVTNEKTEEFEPAEPEIAAVFQDAATLALNTEQPLFYLEKIVEIQGKVGDFNGIETTLKKAIPKIRETEATGFSYAPERFANILANADRHDLAEPLFAQSLNNVQKIPEPDRKVLATIAISAFRNLNGNKPETVNELFDQAEQIAMDIKDEPGRSRALNAVAARYLEFCGCSNWKELSYAKSDIAIPDFKADRDAIIANLSKAEKIIPLVQNETLARELALKRAEVRIRLHDYSIAIEQIESDFPEDLYIRTFFIHELVSDPEFAPHSEILGRLLRLPFEGDHSAPTPESLDYIDAVISALARLHKFDDAREWSKKISDESLENSPYAGFSFVDELAMQTGLALGDSGDEQAAIASLKNIGNENRRREGFRRLAVQSARKILADNPGNAGFEIAYRTIERIIGANPLGNSGSTNGIDNFTTELVSLLELRYFGDNAGFVEFLNEKALENLLASDDCHEKGMYAAVLLSAAIERGEEGHELEKTLLPVIERIFVQEAQNAAAEEVTGRLFDIFRSLQILRHLWETDPLDRIADAVVRRAQVEKRTYIIEQIAELRPFNPPHNLDIQGELEKARQIEYPGPKSLRLLRLGAKMSGLREI